MLTFPKCKTISGCIYTGTWRKNVPVYTVFSENGLNQIVGYVKHINAGNGIVLYRGQCKLYESICPSILRESNTTSQDVDKLISTLDKMSNDLGMLNFFDLNTDDIAGWNLFKNYLLNLHFNIMEQKLIASISSIITGQLYGLAYISLILVHIKKGNITKIFMKMKMIIYVFRQSQIRQNRFLRNQKISKLKI